MIQAASENKKVMGTTENTVRIQISVCNYHTYRLVAIVQHNIKLKHSTYGVLQIPSISLTDKTHLRDLFYKTNSNNIKDLNDPLISGLFDQLFNLLHFYGTLMT